MIVNIHKMLHLRDEDTGEGIKQVAKAIAGGYDVLISGLPDREVKSIWREVNTMLNKKVEGKEGVGWNGMKK